MYVKRENLHTVALTDQDGDYMNSDTDNARYTSNRKPSLILLNSGNQTPPTLSQSTDIIIYSPGLHCSLLK